MSYRVVYGETRPAWEKIFDTKKEADKFSAGQSKCGDIIFSIKKVVKGEKPQSLMAAIGTKCTCAKLHRLPVWYCAVHGEVVVSMD